MSPLPRLVAFDLDDTLAPSKSPVEPRMLEVFARLLARTNVAVISGGNFEQFESQLLTRLADAAAASRAAGSAEDAATGDAAAGDAAAGDAATERAVAAAGSASSASVIDETALSRLHLLPTCGTRYERREHGAWATVYREHLSEVERDSALIALREEAARLGLWESEPWGEILEDRGSQVTFSALGQRAPVAAKHAWDPDGVKKNALRAAVAARLPELEVRSGGSTSVDITRRGIDKAYGMRKLEEHTGISLDEMLFVGDRLDPDGNDYPVLALGVTCHAVTGWEDTVAFLDELLRH
ncbi:HAD-IIB family hydrolase [Leucobacter luti]|uniref:HAD-IIB family hydrolase n=1 Tax=Leucobacter luti TaxID=340320 RepID=UPI00215DB265|nr:HAD-IIB family hydrolase [Leucobacter luti]